jgi:PadR family transcriptional regulator
MGEATAQRGGRRKRHVRVTTEGVNAAASFYDAVVRATHGVSWQTLRRRART